MLTCSQCALEKPESDFYRDRTSRRGYGYICKLCKNGRLKESYDPERERKRRNRPERKKYQKEYRKANREKAKRYMQEYFKNNREKWAESYTKHKEKRNAQSAEYYRTSPQRRASTIIRSRMRMAINNRQSAGSAIRDLGCTIGEFIAHIESLFYPHPETGVPMTWDNWGRFSASKNTWQIDHIQELSSFDLTDREQFIKAANFRNMQPLWHPDHRRSKKPVRFPPRA